MATLNYQAPATVEDAVRILAGAGGVAKLLAGGTDLLVQLRSGRVKPDLIFSDVSMPKVDGYQLGDALKASPDTASIPLVFVTASVQRAQIAEAALHGGSGVLPKPFTMAELRQRVAELLPAAT